MLVPKLRFKREDGTDYPEWKNQKLSAVSSRVTRKNKGNITDIPLTIASLYGLVDQREYFKKTIASQNMEGYYLLHNGEFAYNKSYSKGFDFGAIKRLDRYDCGALSTLYICFAVNNKVDSDFMTHYFDSQKWNKEVSIRCAEGARNHGLLNISTDDFFDIDMTLPTDLEEQQKIADFLSTVDEVIVQSEAEVANLEQQKKAVMQKIFSQEVRFKREDGTEYPEWENVRLGELCDLTNGISKGKDFFGHGNRMVNLQDVFSSDWLCDNSSFDLVEVTPKELDEKRVTKGDVLFIRSSVKPSGVAIPCVIASEMEDTVFSGFIIRARFFNDILDMGYKRYCFIESDFRNAVMKKCSVSANTNINQENLENIKVKVPCLEEQQKIADFLSAYDEAISYAKQELDKWKELKKGLLQQMFV